MLNVWTILLGVFMLLVAARWGLSVYARRAYDSARNKERRDVGEILKQIDKDISSIDRKLLERGVRRTPDSSRDSER